MRIIVYGVGAVGGIIAAALSLNGYEVAGIARGRMLEAMRAAGGLRLRTPQGDRDARFPCYGDPTEIDWREDDVIVLAMKTQDSAGALERLLAAGVYHQPIVCAQNGVANERMALRHFPNVHGMVVMVPAQYSTPGVVETFGDPKLGLFDIGRYPQGTDKTTTAFCAAMNASGFDCQPHETVMENKYAKLLINLGNMIETALGEEARLGPLYDGARAEAEAVYRAAGIRYGNVDFGTERRALMQPGSIPGVERQGSSSFQSLLRNTGSLETDYLNGEIVLLGRLHGVPTPINAGLCRIAGMMIAQSIPAGQFPPADVQSLVAAS